MEQNQSANSDTTLEHALELARRNVKEAKRLLDDAVLKRQAGEVNDDRVEQLRGLMELAEADLQRVVREQ